MSTHSCRAPFTSAAAGTVLLVAPSYAADRLRPILPLNRLPLQCSGAARLACSDWPRGSSHGRVGGLQSYASWSESASRGLSRLALPGAALVRRSVSPVFARPEMPDPYYRALIASKRPVPTSPAHPSPAMHRLFGNPHLSTPTAVAALGCRRAGSVCYRAGNPAAAKGCMHPRLRLTLAPAHGNQRGAFLLARLHNRPQFVGRGAVDGESARCSGLMRNERTGRVFGGRTGDG